MEFDKLISNGQLTKAARLFAKEYYDSGRMGHTRRLLIERLADKCDKYDAEIARKSVTNYEQIRGMSIEEMARTLADGACSKCVHFVKWPHCEKQCTDGRLKWLKQEVEE